MSTLYRFELNWYYARNPIVGEQIVLAVTEEGPVLNCFIDREFFTVPLNNEVGHLCEIIEHSPLRNENGRSYHRLNVNDGAEWSVNIETDEVRIHCDGDNFYPFALKGFWEILHDMFSIPWSTIRKEYRTMKLPMEDEDRYVYVELDGIKHKPSDFYAPAEGPDGIDRWTSNGAGIFFGPKNNDKKGASTMLTFEDAKRIALEVWPTVDCFEETTKAFLFCDTSIKMPSLGGPEPPIVMKEDGTILNMIGYLDIVREDDKVIRPMQYFDGTPVPDDAFDYSKK